MWVFCVCGFFVCVGFLCVCGFFVCVGLRFLISCDLSIARLIGVFAFWIEIGIESGLFLSID
jgi:hypothetical protein